MSTFMQAQLTARQQWVLIEATGEGALLPLSDVGSLDIPEGETIGEDDVSPDAWEAIASTVRDFHAGDLVSVEIVSGFGVRSSAPGYMDRTDWCVYEAEREAIAAYYAEVQENDESDPEATAFDALQIPARDKRLREAWRFHAEQSSTIVGERAAQALRLARAELWLLDLVNSDRARVTIDGESEKLDDCACGKCGPNRDGTRDYQAWSMLVEVLDTDGDTISTASLGMIDVGDTGGTVPDCRSWPYLRTVRAELASELFDEFKPMTTI